jgi:hypothetical protein
LLRLSVAGISPLRLSFKPRSVLVLEELALKEVFLLRIAGFSLSVSFYQCSIFFFIYVLLVTEKQMGQTGNFPKK